MLIKPRWLALAIGLGFGAVITPQLWPYVANWMESRGPAAPAIPSRGPERVMPTAPVQSDPQLAALGTDSSKSDKPLPFVLVGTMPGPRPREGRAMLGTDARNAQTYLAGAILENGARLIEIYADRVILEKKQKRATLYLVGHRDSGESSAEDSGDLLMTTPAAPIATVGAPASAPVTDFIRFIPAYRDDVVVGVRVYPGSHAGPFSKWGLKAGDVITSIDGASLAEADTASRLLARLMDGVTVSARVAREGGDVDVTLTGADVRTEVPVRAASINDVPR